MMIEPNIASHAHPHPTLSPVTDPQKESHHDHSNSELATDRAGFLYGISTLHCLTQSLSHEGGAGLGAAWGRGLQREYLAKAGFNNIRSHDYQNDYSAFWLASG